MTLESISSQDLDNAELIIIDGGSDNETLKILDNYKSIITKLISEKDQGIYDAMNKGIKSARGKWLNFMNAGDKYFTENTLRELLNDELYSDYDLVIGDTIIAYDSFNKKMKMGNLQNIWKGAQFIHQSVLISRKYQVKNFYNIENKISADFEFFYQSIKSEAKIYKLHKIISVFKSGGISDTKRLRALISNMKIVLKYDFSTYKFFYYVSKISLEFLKLIIKYFLPKKVINFFQKINHQ